MMVNVTQVEVRYVNSWKTDEIIALYQEGEWWNQGTDPSFIPELIQNSYVFAVAVNQKTKKAVGMGRVLSDGVSDAYIQDVVVLKQCRGQGIGRLLIEKLIAYCLSHKITWIALISEPGQEEFYIPLGFTKMKHYTPLKYRIN